MAITRTKKEEIVKQVNEILQNNQVLLFVDFSKAKTQMIIEFKKALKELGASYLLIKKNLLKIALNQAELGSEWVDAYQGSFGLVYAENEEQQIELAKAVQKFIKDNGPQVKLKDSLTVLSGLVSKEFWQGEQVLRLAQIPSLEVLQGQLVNLLSQPMGGLVYGLSGILQNFLLTLKEIEKRAASSK